MTDIGGRRWGGHVERVLGILGRTLCVIIFARHAEVIARQIRGIIVASAGGIGY